MSHASRILHLVDVFTDTVGEGNRAGVVLDADGLDAAAMLRIAAAAGASESAFGFRASDPADHDLEVRYFSRAHELPLCGHATIAFHHVRAQELGLRSAALRVKTGAGVLAVGIQSQDDRIRVVMTQRAPRVLKTLSAQETAQVHAALGLAASDAVAEWPLQVVCTGHAKVIVPVRGWPALAALAPDRERLIAISAWVGATGYFPFTLDTQRDDVLYHGRMFAPASGVDEDPVTGNAHGPAGFYLLERGHLHLAPGATYRYRAAQGETMGRPGVIGVSLSRQNDGSVCVRITGDAVIARRVAVTFGMQPAHDQGGANGIVADS